jgi:VWFA-related protein
MWLKNISRFAGLTFQESGETLKLAKNPATFILICALIAAIHAQTTNSPSPARRGEIPTQKPEDVVRITTNLVQVDVTVVDQKGQPVTDLVADDFIVTEDGQPKKITNFSFIAPSSVVVPPPAATPATKPARGVAPVPPPPPVTLRRDQVRRTIALVVDDLGLSFESSRYVRETLKKFVDEQMQPGDLVAIIRTGAGIGALQQFTADKRMLYQAIERVRFNLNSRGFNAFAPIETVARSVDLHTQNEMANADRNELNPSPLNFTSPGKQAMAYRDDIFSVGTLGALNFIVRGLQTLPGRKSVILFSDGFRIFDEDEGSRRILDSLERLVDLANRASVVIYSVDPRGLQTLGLTAADDLSGAMVNDPLRDVTSQQWTRGIGTDLQNRRFDFFKTQQGLNYLAQQTGGSFTGNNNDLDGAVRRILNNQKGYYLLGYRPEGDIFNNTTKRKSFHHIEVKLKKPGLTVRTRAGFYGFSEEEVARPVYRTATDQLYAALASPFASGKIHVRMSSLFGYDPERGSAFTQSILHIDARDMTFNKLPDGTYKCSFQIITATFGDNGNLVDQAIRGYSNVVTESELARTYKSGLIYVVTLPIKKPGAYQLRMAVRDSTSADVGTANQFLAVPDIKKKRLTLSGMILNATPLKPEPLQPAGNVTTPMQASIQSSAPAEYASSEPETPDHPLRAQAIRRFQHLQKVGYGYYIYGARLDPSTHRPRLEIQLRLFRDGSLVYSGKPTLFEAAGQSDMRQIAAGGELLLGTALPAGEYIVQIVVVDTLAKGEAELATQWMDFDLV